jgi:integrase
MGQKVPPGLVKRGDIWHIKKTICGRRVQESTGTSNLAEAERFLTHRVEEIRNAQVYGIRPTRTFKEAAAKYLNEATKVTIREDADHIRLLEPFIGDLPLESVHMGTLQPFIEHRKKQKVKNRTINYALQVVRHMLNLAAGEWLDENGLTWLQHAPKIKLLSENDRRAPYPLSWDEQETLFSQLPDHLHDMALFKVNAGCRESEVCGLKWEWEIPVPELNTSVFIIPSHHVKNREDRLVVLNRTAKEVIQKMRGRHPWTGSPTFP